jgi:hypothetical protein
MSDKKGRHKMFVDLQSAFLRRKVNKKKSQDDAVAFWNEIKKSDNFQSKFDLKMKELRMRNTAETIPFMFQKSSKTISEGGSALCEDEGFCEEVDANPDVLPVEQLQQEKTPDDLSSERKKRPTPAQETLLKQLNVINSSIAAISQRLDLSCTQKDVLELKDWRTKKDKVEADLKKLKACQERSAKNRDQKRKCLEEACRSDPELQKKLKMNDTPGRPSILVDQPDLIKVITEIVQLGASTDSRRRTDVLR